MQLYINGICILYVGGIHYDSHEANGCVISDESHEHI